MKNKLSLTSAIVISIAAHAALLSILLPKISKPDPALPLLVQFRTISTASSQAAAAPRLTKPQQKTLPYRIHKPRVNLLMAQATVQAPQPFTVTESARPLAPMIDYTAFKAAPLPSVGGMSIGGSGLPQFAGGQRRHGWDRLITGGGNPTPPPSSLAKAPEAASPYFDLLAATIQGQLQTAAKLDSGSCEWDWMPGQLISSEQVNCDPAQINAVLQQHLKPEQWPQNQPNGGVSKGIHILITQNPNNGALLVMAEAKQ